MVNKLEPGTLEFDHLYMYITITSFSVLSPSHFILALWQSCVLSTVVLMKTFIHRKYGRYRQDTDMYKRQKQNNNTQYTLQHGSG